MILTKPQRKSIKRKFDQSPDGATSYRHFRRRIQPSLTGDCALMPWRSMWLGIEPDGYTHS